MKFLKLFFILVFFNLSFTSCDSNKISKEMTINSNSISIFDIKSATSISKEEYLIAKSTYDKTSLETAINNNSKDISIFEKSNNVIVGKNLLFLCITKDLSTHNSNIKFKCYIEIYRTKYYEGVISATNPSCTIFFTTSNEVASNFTWNCNTGIDFDSSNIYLQYVGTLRSSASNKTLAFVNVYTRFIFKEIYKFNALPL